MHDPECPESYISPAEKEILRWVLEDHATNAAKAAEVAGRKLSADEILFMATKKSKELGPLSSLSVLLYTPR
ncbi:MAG: hypothetical protein P4L67_05615 [Candidatus Pacebacteria bacterium]|nr:hypothetical protein [Candidatus Paceibacterota bacterium]